VAKERPVVFWLSLIVVIFELWYGLAYAFAFAQLRDRALLLQLGQALLLLAAFGYLAGTIIFQVGFSPFIFVMLLLGALLTTVFWRGVEGNLPRLLRSYPRGTVDVLLFRRPKTVDLKRRVRTK
jgi:hypothetical protein